MARERVRFGIDLDRKTDADFKEIANQERRSKRNMHTVVVERIVRIWKQNPEALKELKLIQTH